jgi:hypothetical protein
MREVASLAAPVKPGEAMHVWGVGQKSYLRHVVRDWGLYSEIKQ